jgi:hypothetical protein
MFCGSTAFRLCVSVPLVLEYEDAAKRVTDELGLTGNDIEDILDYVCSVAEHRQIRFLWRLSQTVDSLNRISRTMPNNKPGTTPREK